MKLGNGAAQTFRLHVDDGSIMFLAPNQCDWCLDRGERAGKLEKKTQKSRGCGKKQGLKSVFKYVIHLSPSEF